MSSQIPAIKAKEYINNYRQDLPPGALRSAWIDKSFIDAIITLSSTHQLDGVRVYMAKYTENANQAGFSAAAGDDTVIVVPTENGFTGAKKDVEEAYYDYAQVCPPHCDDDPGN